MTRRTVLPAFGNRHIIRASGLTPNGVARTNLALIPSPPAPGVLVKNFEYKGTRVWPKMVHAS